MNKQADACSTGSTPAISILLTSPNLISNQSELKGAATGSSILDDPTLKIYSMSLWA